MGEELKKKKEEEGEMAMGVGHVHEKARGPKRFESKSKLDGMSLGL